MTRQRLAAIERTSYSGSRERELAREIRRCWVEREEDRKALGDVEPMYLGSMLFTEWKEKHAAAVARSMPSSRGGSGVSRPMNRDVLAVKRACGAIEGSSDTQSIAAALRFLWDRYLVHPPVTAWWADPKAKNPPRER